MTPVVDLKEAQAFLDCLDATGHFTFQTFDDSPAKRKHMARVFHGSLFQNSNELKKLNYDGAGVFVTVNETDGKGREATNVVRVRALFVDLDGSPIEPVRAGPLVPHLTVESSPGRWHAYWFVSDVQLDQFRPLQRGLLTLFKGDKSVNDLPRVMRLPGFFHRKGDPAMTRVLDVCERPPYTLAEVLTAFGWTTVADALPKADKKQQGQATAPSTNTDQDLIDDLRDALRHIRASDDDREMWVKLGHALKSDAPQGQILWLEWSSQSTYYNPAGAIDAWNGFHPENIGYKFIFAEAKRQGWDPAKAPSIQRKRAAAAARRPGPSPRDAAASAPPDTGKGAAPPPPADAAEDDWSPPEIDRSVDGLLGRFELVYGSKNVWDCTLSMQMPFSAFSIIVGRENADAWMAHANRRVRVVRKGAGKAKDKKEKIDTSSFEKVKWMLPRYVLVYGTETVFDRLERKELTLGALRAYCGLKATRDWGDHPERQVVNEEQVMFAPNRPTDSPDICNLWGGWPISARRGSAKDQQLVDRWLQVLHYGAGESEAVTDWIIKWIAYPLQHPGRKMRTSVIMHGPEGSGKNTIWDAVRRMYGRYGRNIGQTQLESQYSDWLSSVLFLVGNEVLHRAEQIVQKGRLKSLITEETLRVERKYLNGRDEINYANLVFLSNELTPLNIDPEDRRFLVVWTPPAHPDGAAFYIDLGQDSMPDSTVEALYQYFLKVDLGDFNAHTKPPMTQAKQDLIDASLESHQRFVRDWMAGRLPISLRPCKTQQLYHAYLYWCRDYGERFPKAENKFASRAKKELPSGIHRYLVTSSVKQATFYMPSSLPAAMARPPDKSEAAWLAGHVESFKKELEEWRSEQ